ncbi:hypothetical protein J6590_067647 [Homalodisca vitripennis]|nr:hypothetical protein J6590_067647 [Homalodisca vitripennis]
MTVAEEKERGPSNLCGQGGVLSSSLGNRVSRRHWGSARVPACVRSCVQHALPSDSSRFAEAKSA